MTKKHPKQQTPLTPHNILVDRTQRTGTTQIVEIHWTDAQAIGGDNWATETDINPQAAPSLAIGYITHQNETTISIVSLVNNNHYTHGITIPKGCINWVTTLK